MGVVFINVSSTGLQIRTYLFSVGSVHWLSRQSSFDSREGGLWRRLWCIDIQLWDITQQQRTLFRVQGQQFQATVMQMDNLSSNHDQLYFVMMLLLIRVLLHTKILSHLPFHSCRQYCPCALLQNVAYLSRLNAEIRFKQIEHQQHISPIG